MTLRLADVFGIGAEMKSQSSVRHEVARHNHSTKKKESNEFKETTNV